MAKVVCVLYDDPITGYPKQYAHKGLPKLERYYPDGQTLPTPQGIDFKPGTLLGSVRENSGSQVPRIERPSTGRDIQQGRQRQRA